MHVQNRLAEFDSTYEFFQNALFNESIPIYSQRNSGKFYKKGDKIKLGESSKYRIVENEDWSQEESLISYCSTIEIMDSISKKKYKVPLWYIDKYNNKVTLQDKIRIFLSKRFRSRSIANSKNL